MLVRGPSLIITVDYFTVHTFLKKSALTGCIVEDVMKLKVTCVCGKRSLLYVIRDDYSVQTSLNAHVFS